MSKTTYILKDWTSATKMKNPAHPSWRLAVKVMKDGNDIIGHQIIISDTLYARDVSIISAFYVDYGAPDYKTYSISEAVEILNSFGYNCMFDTTVLEIPEEIKKLLQELYDLGYRTIRRTTVNGNNIFVTSQETFESVLDALSDPHFIQEVVAKKINYNDFKFLVANKNVLIEGLLQSSESGE